MSILRKILSFKDIFKAFNIANKAEMCEALRTCHKGDEIVDVIEDN